MAETPAIEKINEKPAVIERGVEQLNSAPRMDINLLRNSADRHTFFIEFENTDAVIKVTINKSIPWQRMAAARSLSKNVVRGSDGTVTAEVDPNSLMRELWSDIVVSTEPKITLTDLDTFSGTVAAEIIAKIMLEYQKFAPDIKVRKK